MRTTLTLAPDVASAVERRRRENDRSLKDEINDLLRIGLRHVDDPVRECEPYVTSSFSVGDVLVSDVDDVQGVLERLEGPGRA